MLQASLVEILMISTIVWHPFDLQYDVNTMELHAQREHSTPVARQDQNPYFTPILWNEDTLLMRTPC